MTQIWGIKRKRDALGFEGIPFSMSRQQVLLPNFRFIGFDPNISMISGEAAHASSPRFSVRRRILEREASVSVQIYNLMNVLRVEPV